MTTGNGSGRGDFWRSIAMIAVGVVLGGAPSLIATRDLASEGELSNLQQQVSGLEVQIARLEVQLGDLGIGEGVNP